VAFTVVFTVAFTVGQLTYVQGLDIVALIALITGGCRSGKSRYALERAEAAQGSRTLIATCPRLDDEMSERISRHQKERQGRGWQTIEEQTDLVGALHDTDSAVVLVDCLSLWINNMMYVDGHGVDEDFVADRCERFLEACHSREGMVLAVTNEVGLGIVPDNAEARRYRDLLGRCNQTVAAGADEVVFMVSGISSQIK
jgi:adenosylcobinamide kinase/adenosylcobinamide-phosphate guanylyltransferase